MLKIILTDSSTSLNETGLLNQSSPIWLAERAGLLWKSPISAWVRFGIYMGFKDQNSRPHTSIV